MRGNFHENCNIICNTLFGVVEEQDDVEQDYWLFNNMPYIAGVIGIGCAITLLILRIKGIL